MPKSAALTLLAALVTLTLYPPAARGGLGPENVAVVVNADSWASVAVANEFIRLRSIPPRNVIYLTDVPGPDPVDVDVFRERILLPVLLTLEARRVAGQMDCVVWSSDLPYAVNVQKDVGQTKLPTVITPVASINGLTYLWELTLRKDINYLGLGVNFYCRKPVRKVEDTPWNEADRKLAEKAAQLLQEKKPDEAAAVFREMMESHPKAPTILYNYACCLARQSKPDEALATLRRAFEAGWTDSNAARDDDDFKTIHDKPAFKKLIDDMRHAIFDVQPAHGFRAAYEWSAAGDIVAADAKGPHLRYLLSTMLAVTSGRGNSVAEATAGLRRSAAADATFPKGTVYYLTNGDVRSRTRQWAFASAVASLAKLGVKAEIIEGKLPDHKADVAGAMVGIADFDWKASGSATVPGAICEHLTSTGAVMSEDGGQTPISAFIRAGCAGTSGTVTEPYALQPKFPTPFLHAFYARGCTLAEAFYQSVEGPYQLLIVGDPLCAPWARRPVVTIEGIKAGQMVKGTLTATARPAAGEGVPAVGRYEWFIDGLRLPVPAKGEGALEVETSQLPEGWHELAVVGITADAIETQGRAVLPFRVGNHGGEVTLSAEAAEVPWDGSLRLKVASTGAKWIALQCNGRDVGRVEGADGAADVPARLLGLGEVRVQAVAEGEKGPAVSAPLTLRILPSARLAAAGNVDAAKLAKGLRLVPEGAASAVVESTRGGDWLAKAGVKPGQAFAADGIFDVPADDAYQFQLRTPLAVSLEVDGKPLDVAGAASAAVAGAATQGEGKRWVYVPVSLAAGSHRLKLWSAGGKDTHLDIRFGGPGSRSLDGNGFRHGAEK